MSSIANEMAEVFLWGRRIGYVTRTDGAPFVKFMYDREFREMGVEVSPVTMPLSEDPYEFPELPYVSFHGLPGSRFCPLSHTSMTALPNLSGTESERSPGSPWKDTYGNSGNS